MWIIHPECPTSRSYGRLLRILCQSTPFRIKLAPPSRPHGARSVLGARSRSRTTLCVGLALHPSILLPDRIVTCSFPRVGPSRSSRVCPSRCAARFSQARVRSSTRSARRYQQSPREDPGRDFNSTRYAIHLQALEVKFPVDIAPTGHRIIGHLLPCLNGIRRAITEAKFDWKLSDSLPEINISTPLLGRVTAAVESDWDAGSEEGRLSLATLQRYRLSFKGISSGLVALSVLQTCGVQLLSALTPGTETELESWTRLHSTILPSPPTIPDPATSKALLNKAIQIWNRTLSTLEEGNPSGDPYSFDILLQCLVSPRSLLPLVQL